MKISFSFYHQFFKFKFKVQHFSYKKNQGYSSTSIYGVSQCCTSEEVVFVYDITRWKQVQNGESSAFIIYVYTLSYAQRSVDILNMENRISFSISLLSFNFYGKCATSAQHYKFFIFFIYIKVYTVARVWASNMKVNFTTPPRNFIFDK